MKRLVLALCLLLLPAAAWAEADNFAFGRGTAGAFTAPGANTVINSYASITTVFSPTGIAISTPDLTRFDGLEAELAAPVVATLARFHEERRSDLARCGRQLGGGRHVRVRADGERPRVRRAGDALGTRALIGHSRTT